MLSCFGGLTIEYVLHHVQLAAVVLHEINKVVV